MFVPAGRSDCCKRWEEELHSYKSEVNSLQSALSACKEEIKLLKHQLSDAESTFSEEVGQRNAQISCLGSELDHKAQLIAHLTKQLHQMKNEFTRVSEASSLMQSIAIPTVCDYNISVGQRVAPEHPDVGTTGRIRRRVRRATASALPHNPEMHQISSKSHERMLVRRSLPTPTHTHSPPSISPRPPSTSPPQRLFHRASRVAHRSARPSNATHLSQDESTAPRPTTSLHLLDPVQLKKQAPDITDLLNHEGNSASNVRVITKTSPSVLPPIPTNSNSVVHQNPETTSSGRTSESHLSYPLHHTRHRHVILARSQGLSSAPSSVRVLTGRTGDLKDDQWQGAEREREEERKATEGMLLVKEETHHQKSQAWQELHQSGSD